MEAFFQDVQPVEEMEQDSEFWLFDIFEHYNNKGETFDEGYRSSQVVLKMNESP